MKQNPAILVLNPGNTSTKVGVFQGETPRFVDTIRHPDEELHRFHGINEQRDFRTSVVRDYLAAKGVALESMDAIAARGGLLKPLASGTYRVDPHLVDDLVASRNGAHASNLAAQIGFSLGESLGIPCFIVDPVSVDEYDPIARYSGHKLFSRVMLTHALNMKAVAKRYARERAVPYPSLNLLLVHLGTGVSLSIHSGGRMIDASNGSDEGAFSLDRAGSLSTLTIARYIVENKLDYKAFEKLVFGNGGLYSYLGTKDFREASDRYRAGDAETIRVVQAMAYQIAKEVGALSTVTKGRLDAILITGGMAYADYFVELIRERIAHLAPVYVYPGEDEMQALAEGVCRVFSGQEPALVYPAG